MIYYIGDRHRIHRDDILHKRQVEEVHSRQVEDTQR